MRSKRGLEVGKARVDGGFSKGHSGVGSMENGDARASVRVSEHVAVEESTLRCMPSLFILSKIKI
jgi:hypothetical protein